MDFGDPDIILEFGMSLTQPWQNQLVSLEMSSTYDVFFKLYVIKWGTLNTLPHVSN
jgi:hypothetical protein